jgi:hypothetical protein
MSIEAMKLMVEALEHSHANEPIWKTPHREAIEAGRAAIEQAEKPVAWADKYDIEREGHDFYVNRQQPTKDGVPLYTAPPQHKKLWLWKNFVDGRPEYWAFDNPYPTNLDNGDPQTLGQPCGYAIFKESRDGSFGRTEEQVLREMKNIAPPQRSWHGLTDKFYEQLAEKHVTNCYFDTLTYAKAIEQALKEKNNG